MSEPVSEIRHSVFIRAPRAKSQALGVGQPISGTASPLMGPLTGPL